MNHKILKPRQALNKAFLKVKPVRTQIEVFKGNLIRLLDQINEYESEEFHKNLVSDFLKRTYYEPDFSINTKGRNDMVIHNGKDGKSPVGVILETKKPTNRGEMISLISGSSGKGFKALTPERSLQGQNTLTPQPPLPKGEGEVTPKIELQGKMVDPMILAFARNNRKDATHAESFLWEILRNRKLNGLKFRRQHPIEDKFVLDFYCAEHRLALEIDGGYHLGQDQIEYDEGRTYELAELGLTVLRFTNQEVLFETEKVLQGILDNTLTSRLPLQGQNTLTPQLPLPRGEGEEFQNSRLSSESPPLSQGEGLGVRVNPKVNLNVKSFQELILYFLRERITQNNLEVKHLVVTNIYEWFVFDASVFEKVFAQNKALVKDFKAFEEGRLSGNTTDFFYKEIASREIDKLEGELPFTYFDLRNYDKPLRNADKKDDVKLIALFKLLSPEHMLKLPFSNDSNSLDKRFYSELLHIIGLTESKEGGKKLIGRNKPGERNAGTILESAIMELDSLDKISRLEKPGQFGNTNEERLFNVALELSITWINRILFLKLLEAQLITYYKGDKSYSFLNLDKIRNYDDLNSLFFKVLARDYSDRSEEVISAFGKVPYLNSSLFEPTEIEHTTLFISNLRDEKTVPIISSTVLKNEQGKKRTGNLTTLEYLFEFLNAYDFSSEGSEDIQEENKTLINASVLGLIFEKINGYKDGSFFTPGFITMYMCRETIRRAVVQKFTESGFKVSESSELSESLDQIYDQIEDRKEANHIINSIKICDPAVGSGHFLVSALNEIIAIKNDLKVLQDRNGRRLKEYQLEVVNDELVVTDEEGKLFEYNPNNMESQRIQETLFHEKQTLIENCLFGVDINPNSVKICRLRLWIELLKSAYYKELPAGGKNSSPVCLEGSEEVRAENKDLKVQRVLETLPNIDINIKCGNSLVSRFAIDADLSEALKKSKFSIDSYRMAVATYRNAQNKEEKREMERLILEIKRGFSSTITMNNPLKKRLDKLASELYHRFTGTFLFEPESDYGNNKIELKRKLEQENLENEIEKLSKKIDEIKERKIYNGSFEWRFEFPEVLNDDGGFEGFDLIIGNPPYIRIQDLTNSEQDFVDYLNKSYESTGKGNYDIYIPFIELGYKLLKTKGQLSYIMPHKFLNANYGVAIRDFLTKNTFPTKIVHFGSAQVFEDATTYTGIFFMNKGTNDGIDFLNWSDPSEILSVEDSLFSKTLYDSLANEAWEFLRSQELLLMNSLKSSGLTLESVTDRIFQGLKTSADKIYIVKKLGETERTYKVYSEAREQEFELEKTYLFPLIKGGNSRPFKIIETELLILFPYQDGKLVELAQIKIEFPKTYEYLMLNKDYLENRESGKMIGEKWYGYVYPKALNLINNPKIFTPDIAPSPRFSYDQKGEFMFTGGAAGGYGIVPKEGISNYFLLAILNSKVTEWFIKLTSTQMRGGWLSFESRYIKNIPMPVKLESKELDELVLKAIETYPLDEDLKNQIDQLVYELYGLTEEEIEIIVRN